MLRIYILLLEVVRGFAPSQLVRYGVIYCYTGS